MTRVVNQKEFFWNSYMGYDSMKLSGQSLFQDEFMKNKNKHPKNPDGELIPVINIHVIT